MRKTAKIILIAVLIVLVVFAALADRVSLPHMLEGLNVAVYLRLVALIAMAIALFVALGYRREVEISQRYRRSQEVLAEAEIAVQRKQGALQQLQEKMDAQFAEKERMLKEETENAKAGYIDQIKALKEQNLKLKETVNTLMQAVKNKK